MTDYKEFFERLIDRAEEIDDDRFDKTEYREVLVPLLFYKISADTFKERFEENLEDLEDVEDKEELARKMSYEVMIPQNYQWDDLGNLGGNVDEELNNAFTQLEEENEFLNGRISVSFQDSDVTDEELVEFIEHLGTENLSLESVDREELIKGFDFLVRKFAKFEDRDPGVLYQPREIRELVAKLLKPLDEGDKIYDPSMASGDFLESVVTESGELGPRDFEIYGQDSVKDIGILAITRFLIGDLYGAANIERGDAIDDPFLTSSDELKEFDRVVSNFPYSADWNKEKMQDDSYDRFEWSNKLPRADRGDYAYIMHMFSALEDDGKMVTLAPQGVLFRKNEKKFRKPMINEDWLETIIVLPEGLFGEDTGLAPAIMILNKDKKDEMQGKCHFIYAGKNREEVSFFEPVDNGNKLTNIEGLAEIYQNRKEIERVSQLIDFGQIEENDFNLNPGLYVDLTEPEEEVDPIEEMKVLESLGDETAELKTSIGNNLGELYDRY